MAVSEETPLIHSELVDANVGLKADEKRQLGTASAISLIFNRIIGTGIFAAPSVILRCSGSVGASLVMWTLGTAIAAAGTAVYIELGSALPKNGGEKNYLEFIYAQPAYLTTCAYASYAVFTGWASANSVVFGEYTLNALALPATRLTISTTAVSGLTFCLVMHGAFLKSGLRLQNALGLAKFFILLAIIVSAALCVARIPGFELQPGTAPSHNLEWRQMWKGSFKAGISGFVTGMFNIVWSYNGYSTANYALGEIRDPVGTLKRAAPLAMISVSVMYFAINLSYFAIISKEDILSSRRIVAALFFRNIFGSGTERLLSAAIALSTLGNIMSIVFTQGRVIQELGREGIIPFSSFFAAEKPFDSPMGGMLGVWVVSTLLMLATPAGDAYLLMINLSYYPIIIYNVVLSAGILAMRRARRPDWDPPFQTWSSLIAFFFAANLFMLLAPFVPPPPGFTVYEDLPYWTHVLIAFCIPLIGIVYWFVWSVWLPHRGGYVWQSVLTRQDDGTSRRVLCKTYPEIDSASVDDTS